MASIDEVMSHRNEDPKWMTDTLKTEEVLKEKHKDPTWMTGSKQKQASQPQAPKASAIPQMSFKVRMCCDKCEEKAKEEASEVPGVVSVVTDVRQDMVTILGRADSAAMLRKLKKHVDKKATYWPEELPVPKVAVAPNVPAGGIMNVGNSDRRMGTGEKGDMKGGYVDKDLRRAGKMDGPGMDQPRMVETMRPDPRTVDPRMVGTARHNLRMVNPRMTESMGPDPRMVDPRMVETGRHDPRTVDPRMTESMRPDPRMVDPRMVETARHNPRMVDTRMTESMKDGPRMVDPKMVDARERRGGGMREMPPVDRREMRSGEVREGWVVDPRERRGGDMREMGPVDMRERRGAEMREMRPVDPRTVDPRVVGGVHVREMQRPIDAREMRSHQYAPADRRERHPEDSRAFELREMQVGAPPVRREMHPVNPRTFDVREMHGGDPWDYGFSDPRTMYAPPSELYYSSRSEEADPRFYQPKDSYFSNYRPSQSYPANYRTLDSYYEEDDMSPYYMNQAVY